MAVPEVEAIKMSGPISTRAALLLASLSLAGSAALAAPASPFVAMAGTSAGGRVGSTRTANRSGCVAAHRMTSTAPATSSGST